jgi:hypothetical protein
LCKVPIRGTASDVVGIDSATRFKKTVNDRRIVTPENEYWFVLFDFVVGAERVRKNENKNCLKRKNHKYCSFCFFFSKFRKRRK